MHVVAMAPPAPAIDPSGLHNQLLNLADFLWHALLDTMIPPLGQQKIKHALQINRL
jgi:hypothetical protein